MRKAFIRIIAPVLQRFSKYYFSKPRIYNYKGIKGLVMPHVFYPHFTWSTALLIDFIEQYDLKDKKALELGCGTGILSVFMAQKEAEVLATDINEAALENTKLNAKRNNVKVETLSSDLFLSIPRRAFDYILINPPYYPKDPQNIAENAWYCGVEFEYFKRLFKELNEYITDKTSVFMILSEDCEIEEIKKIAERNQYVLSAVFKARRWGEQNYIFKLESI